MILIADSGSTKTTWAVINIDAQLSTTYRTSGINPYQQEEGSIQEMLIREIPFDKEAIQQIYYYGAGATSDTKVKLRNSLGKAFKRAYYIDIQNDVHAAAYALCQQEAGIACILGTGSNSCEYDGKKIVQNIGGFGFILGDEGSGAVLGKQLISDFLHHNMPEHLWGQLQETHYLSADFILDQVYRQAYPNRFLATFAPFLLENQQESYIKTLLSTHFHAFFKQKVQCYENAKRLPIHFTGSIAHHFQTHLKMAAQKLNLVIGNIASTPMEGLIRYHQQK
ncbi:MAG: BadF/BadG/BcrA/BcrD ATPase family protein [Bacteroidota bacterium]